MIINRLGLNDLIEPINKKLEFQLQDPFLLYRTAKGEIHNYVYYSFPLYVHNTCNSYLCILSVFYNNDY